MSSACSCGWLFCLSRDALYDELLYLLLLDCLYLLAFCPFTPGKGDPEHDPMIG